MKRVVIHRATQKHCGKIEMQYGCGDSVFFESIEEAIRVSDEIAERAKEKMIHDALSALGVQNCDSCKLLAEKGLRCLRMKDEILREIAGMEECQHESGDCMICDD